MRHSPISILHFLANHYTRLQKLVDHAKKSRLLEEEAFERLSLKEIKSKLLDYKIVLPLPDGQYRLEERYLAFLNFLTSDFSLDLPEQLAKYNHAFHALFEKLKRATDQETIRMVSDKLITELVRFLTHLSENTAALTAEVDALRNRPRDHIGYTAQTKKAVYLITHFLEPLNLILEQHDEAIIVRVREMITYAHDKALHALDGYEATPYIQLHAHLRMTEAGIQAHLFTLVHALLPLLEQIKVGNEIIKGLKLLRDYHNKGQDDKYTNFLPLLHDRNPRHQVLRPDFETLAENVLALAAQKKPVLIQAVEETPYVWYFREGFYQQKLRESLPVENFFPWCLETLKQEETGPIDAAMFFKMASLLFKSEFNTQFTPERVQLKIAGSQLTVPHLRIA